MANILNHLPELEGQELIYVQSITKDFSDNKAAQFSLIYKARRRDPNFILIATLLGFVGVAGIQRILINNIVLGIFYFLTLGFCFIGTIIDLFSYKNLAFEFNSKIANDVILLVNNME